MGPIRLLRAVGGKLMKTSFKKYQQAVNYLEKMARDPLQYDYTRLGAANPAIFLERTKYLLKLLGNPHRGFKFIHITGTAGKGSTTAYIHEMLRLTGRRVGSFTSPFATTSIEKIKVNDKLIDPLAFAGLTEKIKPAIEAMKKTRFGRPAYFECFLAIAFLYFKKMNCAWAALEVGLGGAYDATNVISGSRVSAITNIGLDHTHILGKTKAKIAREKIGIIKSNSHFFTCETNAKLIKIFQTRCRALHTKFHAVPIAKKTIADYKAKIKMTGEHQVKNAALAAAIARHLNISDNVINQAIARVTLPCRFEIMRKNPLIILDGAHNPDKIQSVIHNLKNLTYAKLYTIFACGRAKNAKQMLKSLTKISDEIIFTRFTANYNHAKAADPADLAKLISPRKKKRVEINAKKALRALLPKLKKNEALLITGSFYLAGELRKHWISEDNILKRRATN